MLMYLSIIIGSGIILCAFDIPFALNLLQCTWWQVIIAVIIGIIFEFLIDVLFAIIIKKTPNKWFSPNKKIFNVSENEILFYEKLKIKKWKDRIWELGGAGGFSKRKILNPRDLEYIETFLIEINKGRVIHWIDVFVGFILLFIFPFRFILPITLPITIVNAFLNVLPIMALKYNYPKLIEIRKKLIQKNDF